MERAPPDHDGTSQPSKRPRTSANEQGQKENRAHRFMKEDIK